MDSTQPNFRFGIRVDHPKEGILFVSHEPDHEQGSSIPTIGILTQVIHQQNLMQELSNPIKGY